MTRAGPTTSACPPPAGRHPLWLLALLGLLALQAWLTLGLFGADHPLRRLLDDSPVLSGRHALHLYHGLLGARSLYEHGSLSCYDPAFHAGYPKTPVFDSSSRPAELLLALTGGRWPAATYKIGLAALCLFAPLALFLAARAVGHNRGPACLVAAAAIAIWWGGPCRDALEAGAIDLLWAALLLPGAAGLLVRYHNEPGPVSFAALAATAVGGCFAYPPLFALFLLLFLVYYFGVGARHPLLWHGALWGALIVAAAANAFWLIDWVGYWWIRAPTPTVQAERSAWRALASAELGGGPTCRALALGLLALAVVGVVLYQVRRQRVAARVLGLGTACLLALTALGQAHETLRPLGAGRLVVPMLLLATLPAAGALTALLVAVHRRYALRWLVLSLIVIVAGSAWAGRDHFHGITDPLFHPAPLQIGLAPEHHTVVATLRSATDAQARVLWEDRHEAPLAGRWTPLLPLLTDRAYIGGLDPDAGIDHTTAGLVDGALAGRPLDGPGEWPDEALADYCERYNVGWVVCWTARTRQRFATWKSARQIAELPCPEGSTTGCLFALDRPHTYALRGQARCLGADPQRIVLADVTPTRDDGRGEVVLSFHYQAGMRVAPSRVRIERAEDTQDPIPFVRLIVNEPVARLTITWDRH